MTISRVYRRATALGAVVILLAIGSLPLIGKAQDASPASQAPSNALLQEGERIYTTVCIACHQPDGKGIEGIYLPLAGNPLVTNEDPTYLISTILTGRGGMPSFQAIYSDEEIAAVASFVRQNWDNDAGPVSPEQVAAVRESLYGTPASVATPEAQRPGAPTGTPDASPEGGP